MAKTFANTFLYNKYPNYEKNMIDAIMTSERIDANSQEFEDIVADVKRRQVSSALVQVLKSKNIILLANAGLSTQFKVIACKDVKTDKKLRTFIDVSGIVFMENGVYHCSSIDILIGYLVAAMTTTIYYADEKRITDNTTILKTGATAFAKLFCQILEYIAKISTVPGLKNRAMYLASMYYLSNLLEKDPKADRTKQIARGIAAISEREEEIILMLCNDNTFLNIKFFTESIAEALKIHITVDMVVEKWMYLYGTSTVFGLELFPSFAQMLTDAYVGSYINNQKTIEKVAGPEMVMTTKTLLEIGGRSV